MSDYIHDFIATLRRASWLARFTKTWGEELCAANDPVAGYCAKFLIVTPGFQSSVHRHPRKHETFKVLEGRCHVAVGQHVRLDLGPESDSVVVPPGEWHSFCNLTDSPCVILESSSHHDDADVERLMPSGPVEPVHG